MAWTYADYEEQSTDALRLARLRQHISEVSQAMGPSVSADGKSRDTGSLATYLGMLRDRRKELEAITGTYAPAVSVADLRG